MSSHPLVMTVLTHPFHVLLVGMLLARLARDGVALATGMRGVPPGPDPSRVGVAASSDLHAA